MLLRELGLTHDPAPGDLHGLAEHASGKEREAAEIEYLADDLCLAWLLDDRLVDRGWDEPWQGEITGAIGSGLSSASARSSRASCQRAGCRESSSS